MIFSQGGNNAFTYEVKFDREDVEKALLELAKKSLPDFEGFHVEQAGGYVPHFTVTYRIVEDDTPEQCEKKIGALIQNIDADVFNSNVEPKTDPNSAEMEF